MASQLAQLPKLNESSESSEKECYFTVSNQSSIPFLICVTRNTPNASITDRVRPGGHFKCYSIPECKMTVGWLDKPKLTVFEAAFNLCTAFAVALLPFTIFHKLVSNDPLSYIIVCVSVFLYFFFFEPGDRNRKIKMVIPMRDIEYKFYQKRSFIAGIFQRKKFHDIVCVSD